MSTETSNTVTQLALVFPLIAFVVGAIATLHKALRTGAIWSWQMAGYPADQLERILWFYSVPVLLLGMAITPFVQYAPMLWNDAVWQKGCNGTIIGVPGSKRPR